MSRVKIRYKPKAIFQYAQKNGIYAAITKIIRKLKLRLKIEQHLANKIKLESTLKKRCISHLRSKTTIKKLSNKTHLKDFDVAKIIYNLYRINHHNHLDQSKGNISEFKRVFREDLNSIIVDSPYFQSNLVEEQLSESDLSKPKFGIQDWLTNPKYTRIVPSKFYQDCWFRKMGWIEVKHPWQRYLYFLENLDNFKISSHPEFDRHWYYNRYLRLSKEVNQFEPLHHYLTSGSANGFRTSFTAPFLSKSLQRKLSSSIFEQIIDTGNVKVNGISYSQEGLASLKDQANLMRLSHYILNGIDTEQIDYVVLMPRCGIGGAASLTGIFCKTLEDLYGAKSVLMIRTDDELFLRPDWFSQNIKTINLQDFIWDIAKDEQQEVLLDLIKSIRPKITFSINSFLGWTIFVNKIDELKKICKLGGYDFCYSVSQIGQKTGFPVSHIPKVMSRLDILFLDNKFLKDDLIRINDWEKQTQDKIRILYTPVDKPKDDYTWSPPTKMIGEKKKIFWGGRFDRQKRLDIAKDLAKRNPDWEFHVWGQAMLDKPLDTSKLPDNMFIHGPYEHIDDLPLNQCDVWLYTAQWDGIPLQIVGLGLRGLPIVSTDVWGLKEVVSEATAFPVSDINDLRLFEEQINYALTNPLVALSKGSALKKHTTSQHNYAKYKSDVKLGITATIEHRNQS